ncbi:MAG: hypothetical protein AB7S53_06605 [Thiomonas sp.]
MTTTTETRAERLARLRAAYQTERQGGTLPPDLQADLQALRDAGLHFQIIGVNPAPPAPAPLRKIAAAEVEHLDARHPMLAMYLYQQAYAVKGEQVPAGIVANLRCVMRDEHARQKRQGRHFAGR